MVYVGREAVVKWLLSNQVVFEIIFHGLLKEGIEALADSDHQEGSKPVVVFLTKTSFLKSIEWCVHG